ncbi:hypothetical protein IJG04_02270 [Candidatus Saccharibacteria bacterium]|nr:hypothetical protein [Candidatus Saccharibacteria bacterium]
MPQVMQQYNKSKQNQDKHNSATKSNTNSCSCASNYEYNTKKPNKSHILLTFLPLGILALITTISFFSLSSSTTSADTSTSSTAKVNVAVACTLSGSTTTHAVEVLNGAYNDNITGTTLRTICNGSGNYNIYAVGYTNNTEGNNTLYSSTSGTIPTGTTLNGTTSNWAMKLANSTGNTATIENNYNTFQVVPSTSTLVASYNATTSSQTTDSTLQTTYGVSISPNQPAGTYTGAVKYTMNYTEYAPPPMYMQDFTLERCIAEASDSDLTLYDRRDESDYTVRYINGACWMTQNLRITGTISSTNSNFSTNSSWNVKAADLKGSSYSYTEAQSHVADSTDVSASSSATGGPYTVNQLGAWYNYCSASAGTVCSQTQLDASEDICPSGWHLPSYNTSPGSISGITSYSSAFSPIYGGYYYNGLLNSATTYGRWWSATASSANGQYNLYYYNGSLNTNYNNKRLGHYVRCVRTS